MAKRAKVYHPENQTHLFWKFPKSEAMCIFRWSGEMVLRQFFVHAPLTATFQTYSGKIRYSRILFAIRFEILFRICRGVLCALSKGCLYFVIPCNSLANILSIFIYPKNRAVSRLFLNVDCGTPAASSPRTPMTSKMRGWATTPCLQRSKGSRS